MSVLVTFTVGLMIWLVMWSLGVKAFDAFLLTIALTVLAATMRVMQPFLNKLLKPGPIE